MQNTPSSSNLGAMGTGIVPTPTLFQQTQYMQSTTPSTANGKDEMRGWLYKWTNVENETFCFIFLFNNISLFST